MADETYIDNEKRFFILKTYAFSFIIFGLLFSNYETFFDDIFRIITEPDFLIVDYIKLSGIGAAFLNCGIVTMAAIMILKKAKVEITGVSIASLWTLSGFSLFGKNIFNVWFVIIGVFIYSKIRKESFRKYVYIAFFGTSLSPIITQIIFSDALPSFLNLILAFITSTFLGFLLPPLSSYFLSFHRGYNLYNVGFTAGIIATFLVSILRAYGYSFEPRILWSSGNNVLLGIYLYVLFLVMIYMGYRYNKNSFSGVKKISTYSGRLVTDFVLLEGMEKTLINMGSVGLAATSYILLTGAALNGPTIGGIFTIVGFGAFGKHLRNIIPIFLGVFLGSITNMYDIHDPNMVLAALFGTTLAPIAGEFGIFWGIIAGFLHSSLVTNLGYLHGGMNLYNNGFSGGLVAAFLLPIIQAFERRGKDEH